MTFTPVVPSGGYGGWSFLNRTMAAQKKAFADDPALQRDEAYFRDRIGKVSTAEDLVADRRLLSVALSAFGLEGDINNKAFLKKILNDGTFDPAALGNRLADKRYLEFSRAFGFGDFAVPNTKKSDFPDKILSAYQARKFEAAVGLANGGHAPGVECAPRTDGDRRQNPFPRRQMVHRARGRRHCEPSCKPPSACRQASPGSISTSS